MLQGFFQFAQDKPTARYLLDMDATSPAGWDIKALCQQYGWDAGKLIFKADAVQRGVTNLRDRYNALDAHAVLSYREGYGLPLSEAMACGVVSAALDWCSGTEVTGEGRGVLVKPADYFMASTWGGAADKLPDVQHFVQQLNWLHDHPEERAAMGIRGMIWARAQSWDKAADAVMAAVEKAKAALQVPSSEFRVPSENGAQKPDGVQAVALVEAGA